MKRIGLSLFTWCLLATSAFGAAARSVVIEKNPSPRVVFGAEAIVQALAAQGVSAEQATADAGGTAGQADAPGVLRLGRLDDAAFRAWLEGAGVNVPEESRKPEGYVVVSGADDRVIVAGADASGLLYGCLELARRIRESGGVPESLHVASAPELKLRGAAIGMQKTTVLPGRKVYEYPYTPELFPFFYDKAFWRDYLDRLVELRMNTLYLWNGHPFASLVRLPDYPYAVEVSDEVFDRNVEMLRYLTAEADKRGIWLVQMFYNIILSKPFAERHGLSTQLDAIHPVAADYTRKSIAEFVRQYPNVGLLVCLGEALQDIPQQSQWCNDVILAGVKDGMKLAGLTQEPPVVIRAHATDESVIIPAALKVYGNLYTMAKYNGESLTTWEPRGVWQQRHLAMSRMGSTHVVNVHILANLEPFRYGAPRFIRRSVEAMRDRLGAGGLHLYPLTYWNWPYSPDRLQAGDAEVKDGKLTQLERDWIWFEAWARYAWEPDVDPREDRAYWIGRLQEKYGTAEAGALLLDAYNDAGECAPRLLRRFGITEGNRQTFSLGMTLEQLVEPEKARPYPELWLSQAPPGERLQEYVTRERLNQPHEGETPPEVVAEVLEFAERAVMAVEAAAPNVTRNRAEYERLRNDVHCIRALSQFYAEKARAAERVLRHRAGDSRANLEVAAQHLEKSVEYFRTLVARTEAHYAFANSMQTSMRRVPVRGQVDGTPVNFHWRDLLPVYEQELETFRAALETRSDEAKGKIAPLAPVAVRLPGTKLERYPVREGQRVFADAPYELTEVSPTLQTMEGVRLRGDAFEGEAANGVEFDADRPVRVLIGYLRGAPSGWRKPPELETDALAAERGGGMPILTDAARLRGLGTVDVYALDYAPGRHRIALPGSGRFLLLGFAEPTQKTAP